MVAAEILIQVRQVASAVSGCRKLSSDPVIFLIQYDTRARGCSGNGRDAGRRMREPQADPLKSVPISVREPQKPCNCKDNAPARKLFDVPEIRSPQKKTSRDIDRHKNYDTDQNADKSRHILRE